ncbi:zinc-dependent alcohol dehydrogenase [Pseudonocardia kunmingensis]|uniref:Threonine dehydrogenase-like Zn-dependent dehydrogenase n=1 Tax=Pseudonocardia kunmingensis TaxID=630975 RepID=A0A543DL62_9PSEU|nr:zinc-binding dehydrogenase [Pseudonocardia kunmingensis]TQM10058.1 threonine dehydrogenase-like Zn-dependent dehydrogenase [Pseudonocardia kunmingensis]
MWAQQLTGPATLQPVEVPAPAADDLRPGEVLVGLEHGGICGSDLPHFRAGGRPGVVAPPGFPLHEIVGRVRASRDPGIATGERVVGWASAADALAELVVTAGSGLHPVGGDGSGVHTVVAQPLACVLYAVDQLGDVRGKRAAVLGLGAIGLLFAWALRQRGAASVVGVDPVDRTAHATTFGLDEVVVADSRQWAQAVDARPDVIVEAVGHQTSTVADAVHAVADQGTVYCFGIPLRESYPIDLTAVVRRNLRIIGGLTLDRRAVLGRALQHLDRAPQVAAELVTDVRSAADATPAYTAACTPAEGRLKAVLEFDPA